MSRKFKVGDEVIWNADGETYTITRFAMTPNIYVLGNQFYAFEDALTLARCASKQEQMLAKIRHMEQRHKDYLAEKTQPKAQRAFR